MSPLDVGGPSPEVSIPHETSAAGDGVADQSLVVQQTRVTLADIRCRADIEALSVRQLKVILVNSYVDYRGCCEKTELVQRVFELWDDHNRINNGTGECKAKIPSGSSRHVDVSSASRRAC